MQTETIMKIRTAILAVAFTAAALAGRAGEPARFTPAKVETTVTIKGTSSLHEWEMKGTTIGGAIQTDPDAWKTEGQKPATASVTIPVKSIRSEHDRMDRIMAETLKAATNPDIRYEMTSAALLKTTGDSFVVRTNGKLSIAGVTRDITLDVNVHRTSANRYVLTAQTPLKMTDYGMKPPVAMMGTLKTGDQITVAFRWVVDRSQG